MFAVELCDISFRYGPRFALSGAEIHVRPETFVAIIGPNGSGKTTLLKIISGLLSPDSGKATLLGKSLTSYSVARRARHLAYVPQRYEPAFSFTVEQTVLLGRMPYRRGYGSFESEADLKAADKAIALMDLTELRSEPITELSGGELQRVMIAKALAQETEILVLDEPTSHLDIAYQQHLLGMLRSRMPERGLTVIMTLHDLNLASIYSDSIALMNNGRLLRQGAPHEVLTENLLRDTFGLDLHVEPGAFGTSPAIRYRTSPASGGSNVG